MAGFNARGGQKLHSAPRRASAAPGPAVPGPVQPVSWSRARCRLSGPWWWRLLDAELLEGHHIREVSHETAAIEGGDHELHGERVFLIRSPLHLECALRLHRTHARERRAVSSMNGDAAPERDVPNDELRPYRPQHRASVMGKSPTPSISTGEPPLFLRRAPRVTRMGRGSGGWMRRSAACTSCVTVISPSPSNW